MNFIQLAKARCSMRAFTPKQVEEEKLSIILESALIAPTAVNYQPQKILVIRNAESLDKLKNSSRTFNAPLVLVVCCDKDISWIRKYDDKSMSDIDGTIVADHIVMTAESLGLGTCWITAFNPAALKIDFNIPNNIDPVAIIAIGYDGMARTLPDRHNTKRKHLSSIIVENTF